jgi:hypothetical protein
MADDLNVLAAEAALSEVLESLPPVDEVAVVYPSCDLQELEKAIRLIQHSDQMDEEFAKMDRQLLRDFHLPGPLDDVPGETDNAP